MDQGPAYSPGQIVSLSTTGSCPPADPGTGNPNSLLWSAVSTVDGTTLASGVSAPASSALVRLPDPNNDLTRLHSYSSRIQLELSCTGGFSGYVLEINFTPCPNGCSSGSPHYLTISPTSGASGTSVALFTDCRPTDLMYGNVIAEPSGTTSGWSLYLGKGSPASETINLGTAPYLVAPGDTWFYLTAFGTDPLTGVSANCGGSASFTFIDPVTAGFTFHPVAGLPFTVDFDAGSSGGMPTAWSWSFGDGSTGTGLQPRHQFPARGSYSVTLTVSRGAAVTDSVTKTVKVAPPLVVNTTDDHPPLHPAESVCDTGKTVETQPACSLRAAVATANAMGGGEIDFAIPGNAVPRIPLTSALPFITKPIVIDGTTEPAGRVAITGLVAGAGTSGLVLSGGTSTVRGLVISGFAGAAIVLDGGSGSVIVGNLLGTTSDGATAQPNATGVAVKQSSGNTIGGTVASDRNVIVARGAGVSVTGIGAPANNNVISGNFIGTNADGTASLVDGSTGSAGVLIGALGAGASHNQVTGNTISGTKYGVDVFGPTGTQNIISGNHIGTTADGAGPITGGADALYGVRVDGTPSTQIATNVVTGPFWAISIAGNVQANGDASGITFNPPQDSADASGATNNATTVTGNTVGLMADGVTQSGPKGSNGVIVWAGADYVTLTNNVVARHSNADVEIDGGTGHQLTGNRIGTTAAGDQAVGSGQKLTLSGTTNTIVGGDSDAQGNVLLGLAMGKLKGHAPTGTTIRHNRIGINDAGDTSLSQVIGINLGAGDNTTIGPGNVISGNTLDAVLIADSVTNTTVTLNRIGVALNANTAIANGTGIGVGKATNTTIGPGNVISGNTGAAIASTGTTTVVVGNFIGVPSMGDTNLGNSIGVFASSGDIDVEANTIAHTTSSAGVMAGPGVKATILHNRIYDNSDGKGIVAPQSGKAPGVVATARVTHTDHSTNTTTVRTWLALDKLPLDAGTLEVFGNPDCSDPEGRTPLFTKAIKPGSENIVVTIVGRPEMKGFTATVTSPDGYTTAFTSCGAAELQTDANGDGLPDIIEAQSTLVANGGTQTNIATFPNDASDWVVVHSPNGTQLTDVGPADDPAPGSHPAGFELPAGLLTFTVNGVTPGGSVAVEVATSNTSATSYWRYGPPTPGATPTWYDWSYSKATQTGAQQSITGWHLNFVDGGAGDDDGLANGVVHDPGGPANVASSNTFPPTVVTPLTPSTGAGDSSTANAFGSLLLAAGVLVLTLAPRRGRRCERNVAHN